ncbi:MAG: DUF5658 family protein [Planctomycetaceae bacterium]
MHKHLLIVTICHLLTTTVSLEAGEPAVGRVESNNRPATITGEPIPAGFVISDGAYIPPPYVVSWRDQQLYLNDWNFPHGLRRENLQDVDFDAEPHRGRSRFTVPPAEIVGRLERRLCQGELLVRTEDGRCAEFLDFDALAVLSILNSTDSRLEKLVALMKMPGQTFNSHDWGRALDDFQCTDELQFRMAGLRSTLEQQMEGLEIVHAGGNRQYAYALTVAGMVLVVLAFGTVLTFKPNSTAPWRAEDRSDGSVKLVLRCVLLMCVLSLFDLLCTFLARSAGQFSELNPLANTLLDNPFLLVTFKITMTGLAALILWRLRHYRGTQVASWWLCLLLTLLAVRWVAVESLLMA